MLRKTIAVGPLEPDPDAGVASHRSCCGACLATPKLLRGRSVVAGDVIVLQSCAAGSLKEAMVGNVNQESGAPDSVNCVGIKRGKVK